MPERIRLDYDALFRVDVRLSFFLNRGEEEFEHMTKTDREGVLRSYDVRDHLEFWPTDETRALLERHRLLFRTTPLGFAVYASLANRKMRFPFTDGIRMRFLMRAQDRSFSQYAGLTTNSDRKTHIYRFATDAANQDPEGRHLTKPLNGFRSASDYPVGSHIVNNVADPIRRLTAVRNIARGAQRQDADWVETQDLPSVLRQPFVATLSAGETARKDGVVYAALVDSPGDDETNANEWQRLFAPGVQAASSADVIPLAGRHLSVTVEPATPEFVLAELKDHVGATAARQVFRGSAQEPLRNLEIDTGGAASGEYLLTLKDAAGNLLRANGVELSQASQTIYLDSEAVRRNALAIIEVDSDSPGYELTDGAGDINSPTYLLRIPSVATFWRYTFPTPLTSAQQQAIGADFEMAGDSKSEIITSRARSLARGLVRLQRLNTGKLLPNPTEQTGIAIESNTGKLISPIYLSNRT